MSMLNLYQRTKFLDLRSPCNSNMTEMLKGHMYVAI